MKTLGRFLLLTVLWLAGCDREDTDDPEFLRERISAIETQIRFENSKIKVAKEKREDKELSNLKERFDTIIAKGERRIEELQRELEKVQAKLEKVE